MIAAIAMTWPILALLLFAFFYWSIREGWWDAWFRAISSAWCGLLLRFRESYFGRA